jgi:anti-sigma regulatory factor (Ser/Thr protein kinase)
VTVTIDGVGGWEVSRMSFDPSAWKIARVRVSLPAAPESVALARRAVDELLGEEPVSDLSANLKLVVSELMTNAVTHSSPGDEIQLALTRFPKHVHVSVRNRGPLVELEQLRGGRSEGGRGLEIVTALARGWSIDTRPTGTTVTVRVPAPTPPGYAPARPTGSAGT